ncbi:MAG: SAM-dependent chlorinase/fluorinase [Candidatus Paceibacterota bacterium]
MEKQIVLEHDFGFRDGASSVMEGVIDRIDPDIKVKLLTPHVAAFDHQEGAFLLLTNYWHFRKGTVFIAVVDPGVGTDRKILLVQTENYCFVGPDNGILGPVMEAEKIERIIALNNLKTREAVWKLTKDDYFLRPSSDVFEGRDIYCPAAALYIQGVTDLGEEIKLDELKKLSFVPRPVQDNSMGCEVIFIDDYGNLLLSCTEQDLNEFAGGQECAIAFKDQIIPHISKTYANAEIGELIAVFGGDFEHPIRGDFLEIAINEGNAARTFKMKKGDKVIIEK